ncbi:unnamed protein product, partial [Scytosiphon promiscuus]
PIQDDAVGIRITSPSNDEVLPFQDTVLTFETRGFTATVNTPIEASLKGPEIVFVPQNGEIPFILTGTTYLTLSSPRPCTQLITLSATVHGQRVSTSVLFSTIPDKAAILSARIPLPADAVWGPRSEAAPSQPRRPEVSPTAHRSSNTSEQGPLDMKGLDCQLEPTPRSNFAVDTEGARPISLVFVGDWVFDGQKYIWLEQMERLSRARFTPKYLTFHAMHDESKETDASIHNWKENGAQILVQRLGQAGVQLIAAQPSMVNVSQVADSSGQQSDTRYFEEKIMRMVLDSYDRAAGDPHLMSPPWTRDIFQPMADAIKYASPDVLVIANGQSLTDVVLTRATRWAMGTGGVKIVMDCPNLRPAPGVDIDALATPSHYVSRHPETEAVAAAAGAPVVVIPPGVRGATSDDFPVHPLPDAGGILPPRASGESINEMAHAIGILEKMDHCHPACHIVGFAGRLAPEKSPGLFMVVAQALAELIPSAIFVVVGDGPLKLDLEATAERLGIASRVHFTGWAYGAHLQRLLKGMTLLFNPSLAESETFCIVNIEAMSLGTPVAAFGIGGMLEYGNFELLDDAEPRAVAATLAELLLDRPRLGALAERGRVEVMSNFQADVALDRWALLYETLVGRGTATL